MKKDQLYAIVDIEATGASIGRDERMIQFACVLMKNNEIVETFDTFVNPSRKVNKVVRDLTGITAKDLATAPYFEDVALIIHTLLEDTIFVAHNVGFDYQFLNECFGRAGFEPLSIPAIDTVELAQILFPTEDSYQLKELTSSLGYTLLNAHNALFDAKATAFLLEKLSSKLKGLPLVTLESLSRLSGVLTADTGLFIRHALEEALASPTDLPSDSQVVNGLAMRKPEYVDEQENYRQLPSYPFKEDDKEQVMQSLGLHKRESQTAMMNEVFEYFKTDSPDYVQFIEAAAGSGKTFGYLLPSFYLSTRDNKLLISTYTKLLQKQISDESIPLLNSRLPFKRTAALLKSASHYLSLAAFSTKLKQVTADEVDALFCMKILVWLLETQEGDLEEMGVGTRLTHRFWEEVRSHAHTQQETNAFESVDFMNRRQKRLDHASIIVTNHAYLLTEWGRQEDKLSESLDANRLIIDEAHHLPDVIDERSTVTLRTKNVSNDLKALGSILKDDTLLYSLNEFPDSFIKPYQLTTLESLVQVLLEEWEDWLRKWIDWMKSVDQYDDRVIEWKETSVSNAKLPMDLKRDSKFIKHHLSDLLYVGRQIKKSVQGKTDELSKENKLTLSAFNETIDSIEKDLAVLDYIFFETDSKSPMAMRFYTKSPINSLSFYKFDRDRKDTMLKAVTQYEHVLLTSSTLSVNGSTDYLQDALSIKKAALASYESPYDYAKQGRLFIPTEDTTESARGGLIPYATTLTNQIEAIVSQTDENCLVLFRSQEVIQEVYRLMKKRRSLQNKTILAQYVSGTPVKISKLFKKSSQSIVLGSDSFWEGVDFPEDELKMVVMTRLPFDSPEMPLVKKRHQELTQQGKNPFVHDLLPRAVVKFKQGIGRLIRSPEDKGIWVVLDRRVVDASYAHVFLNTLPSTLPIEQLPIGEIKDEIVKFFE